MRHAAFQAVSVMTTTGFATLDWTTLGAPTTLTLLVLMFVGASAGSTSGSMKVVRDLTLLRPARRELGAFEALGAAAACLGNVGPAFGIAGPYGSNAGFSDFSTAVLTGLICLGRVEIVPIALLLTRTYWRA